MKIVIRTARFFSYSSFQGRTLTFRLFVALVGVANFFTSVANAELPSIVGEAAHRVAVGPGAAESSIRQIVRALDGYVYIAAVDDQGGPANGFEKSTVLRMYKSTTAGIPTAFHEVNRVRHPRTSRLQTLSGGDMRLDRNGIVHLVYYRTVDGATVYKLFDTNTDTWESSSTVVTTFSGRAGNAYYGARGRVINSIALDQDGTPYITVAGDAGAKVFRQLNSGWIVDTTLSTAPSLHPAMTFDRLNRLHVVWLENPNDESSIHYAMRDSMGGWGSEDLVFPGDTNVLTNVNRDQGPSLAVDSQNKPVVLYVSGDPGFTNDFVQTRVMTAGLWVADDPPEVFSHAPGLYMQGDIKFVLLGHDDKFHPGYLTHRPNDPDWSSTVSFQPDDPSYQYDGSISARYDPQYQVDCSVIDVVYFDEDSDTRGGFRPDLYYTAIKLNGEASGNGSCREGTP
jgi:hypothetical protein